MDGTYVTISLQGKDADKMIETTVRPLPDGQRQQVNTTPVSRLIPTGGTLTVRLRAAGDWKVRED